MVGVNSVILVVALGVFGNVLVTGAEEERALFELTLQGLDVVNYWLLQDGELPAFGAEIFRSLYKGYSFYFANSYNQEFFNAHKSKYVPEYGGYCAWAIADSSTLACIMREEWYIYQDRLFLFCNAEGKANWLQDPDTYIAQSDAFWVDKYGTLRDGPYNTGAFCNATV
eukprot:CAMPEP_0119118882 /NCGR_PEP_ID=MMETSP1310-20130426/612_1 /TAXON_ID=464262 /ORGANISM="Genus nov. species nov., Strain RCC2339" /LENGTH=168 /DNA_ID=CAMNT_0007108281 /DNA_START=86 /DNA_END=592 /DNA_ORIENTATION=+